MSAHGQHQIIVGGRRAGRSARLRRQAERDGARVIERDPRPGDPDYGRGPRYHRISTEGMAGGLWTPPPRDILAEAAENGMGC